MRPRTARIAARATALLVGAALALGATAAGPTAAGAAGPTAARRMLVVSLPMVTWADLDLDALPNLRGLLAGSAVADLSVRGVDIRPTIGDAYATISAGTRSVGTAADGLGFGRDERFGGERACAAAARNAGPDCAAMPGGSVVALGFPAVVRRNSPMLYDAEPGSLGQALATAGVNRAVIGNADEQLRVTDNEYRRFAASALATANGVTPQGAVGSDLLQRDPAAAFGLSIRPDAFVAAFERAWSGRSVVLVEDSDLLRYAAMRAQVATNARRALLDHALQIFDGVLGRMLASVDPARDAVLVVGPAHFGGELTVAALRAPGVAPGLATSGYTRRDGFVSIVDIAPTILDTLRVKIPASMEGRPLTVARAGGSLAQHQNFLVAADRAAVFRDTLLNGVSGTLAILLVILSGSVLVIARLRRPARVALQILGLSLLGGFTATYLAGLVPFYRYDQLWYWGFLLAVALALGGGSYLFTNRRGVDPLLVCLGAVVGVLVVDAVSGAHLELNTVFGYSPIVGGRFAGMGNTAFALLSTGALFGAALLAARVGGRRGAALGVAVLVIAVVVDGMPAWGSDVGGVLSMVPAYAIVVSGLVEGRVRIRSVVIGLGATAAAIGAFALIDLARPSNQETHLGRLIHSTHANGSQSLVTTLLRKLHENFAAMAHTRWGLTVPLVLAALFVAARFIKPQLDEVRAAIPPLRFALGALLVLAALGFALNDSGITIPAVMLGVVAPVLVTTIARTAPVDE